MPPSVDLHRATQGRWVDAAIMRGLPLRSVQASVGAIKEPCIGTLNGGLGYPARSATSTYALVPASFVLRSTTGQLATCPALRCNRSRVLDQQEAK